MSSKAGYLKAAWVSQHLDLAVSLLPAGTAAAVRYCGKLLAVAGAAGPHLADDTPLVRSYPLVLEGNEIGIILLKLPPGAAETAAEWGGFLVHGLQGMIEAHHARYAVAREALESYREMASLRRAVTNLHDFLKPSEVFSALLKEFGGRKDTADFGAVFLSIASTGSYDLAQCFGDDAGQAFLMLKNSPLFADMANRETGDIVNDLLSSPLWSGEPASFQALLWLPLISHNERLGLLMLASRRADGFSSADLKRAQTLSSVAIQRAHLLESRLSKLNLERDLAIARDIQQKVLPTNICSIFGYELAVFNQPADETGGDIYDVIPLSPDTLNGPVALLVADATGHGIGPALSVTQARSMVRMAFRFDSDLEAVITQVNNQLRDDLDRSRFIAAFIGVLDPQSHRLDYHACGLGPALHFHADTGLCEQFSASTLPLGVIPDLQLDRPVPMIMKEGDIVLLLTDGFWECNNAAGDMLGIGSIIRLVTASCRPTAAELMERLIAETIRFTNGSPQADDLTAVILKRTSPEFS